MRKRAKINPTIWSKNGTAFKKVILNLGLRSKFLTMSYVHTKFIKDLLLSGEFNLEKIRLFLKVKPHTVLSFKRLDNAYDLAKKVEGTKTKGAIVECGVWKGGCIAMMASLTRNRKIWAFDSFEGLPKPDKIDSKEANIQYSASNCLEASKDDVAKILSKLKVDMSNVMIKKGWFQAVLPKVKNKIGHIALLRIDGDWYESTKVCLEELYGNVVKNGYVIIDDYGAWIGAKKATDEFRTLNNIKAELVDIDGIGVYWKK